MPIKIGVILPNSNYIPSLARGILGALELALNTYPEINYELCIEPAGYNANKLTLIGKIQALLIKERVDVVTAPLNAGLLVHLNPHFSGQQVPLIVNTLGEDVVSHDAHNPYLFVNSFNLWQTSWLSGYWAASVYGKSACTIAGLHDGGYGMGFAFALGLEAQEGTLVQAAITHRQSRTEDPSDSIKRVVERNPNFIMGLYSGKEAVSFLEAYDRLGLHQSIPLIGLPFMVDESRLAEAGEWALGVQSLSCWRQDTEQNKRFAALFKQQIGRTANCYALMAYETGHLIAQAVQAIGAEGPLADQLPEALQAVEFDGPRGVIKFDAENREVQTVDYLREVVMGEDGRFYNKIVKAVEPPPLFHEQLALARQNLAKQGWLNPYLVA